MEKKLFRSRSDRLIAGVCGGLGEYLDIDPVWMRLFFVLLIFAWGIGLWAYLILWLIVPDEARETTSPADTMQANVQEMADRARELGNSIQRGLPDSWAPSAGDEEDASSGDGPATGPFILGIVLVLVGLFLIFNQLNLFAWLRWDVLFALILVFVGGVLLLSQLKE
jgi:phage shock protein C